MLLEEGGEAWGVVLKRAEPASPQDLAALHHVQPLGPRLVPVLALVGDRVDDDGRAVEAERCDEGAGCGQPVLVRASEGRRCELRRSPRVLPAVGRVRLGDVDEQVVDLGGEGLRGRGDLRERLDVGRSRARAKVEDGRPARVQDLVERRGGAVEAEAARVGRGAVDGDGRLEARGGLVAHLVAGGRVGGDGAHGRWGLLLPRREPEQG